MSTEQRTQHRASTGTGDGSGFEVVVSKLARRMSTPTSALTFATNVLLGARQGGREPLGPPIPRELVTRDVARLPRSRCLARCGDLEVWRARAVELPHALHEIGRLREQAFRAVGEGTGAAFDLDRFDHHYEHLFAWNSRAREIIGAYRVAEVSEVVAERGIAGLYTSTLFEFDERFLARLQGACELGRSFVRPDQQKAFAPLMLLWKAIGAWVCERPERRTLFGPATISPLYSQVSLRLMLRALESRLLDHQLAALVQPRHRLARWADRAERPTDADAWDLDELDRLIRDVEGGVRGMPILLREYVRLGGRAAAYGKDPSFGGATDVLLVADLALAPRRTLERYLGGTGSERFLERCGAEAQDASEPAAA
jgi:putative hemolysin